MQFPFSGISGEGSFELVYVPFVGARELDGALAAVAKARADAMLVFPEGVTVVNRAKIAQFAIAQLLPSMFGWSEYCDAGGRLAARIRGPRVTE